MKTHAQPSRQEQGSALLLTLLLTLVGAMLFGLGVDAMSLVWVRSSAQTTANLAASAVALELTKNPSAPQGYLEAAARAAAAHNGYRHGTGSAVVRLEKSPSDMAIFVGKDTGIYFLRMIRPEPIPVHARALVKPAPKAGG